MSFHNNDVRILTEFGAGKIWKVAKVIKMHEDGILGNHYHKEKDECFVLVYGNGNISVCGKKQKMILLKEYFVKKGNMHSFELKKGSVLVGLCSEVFNPDDDYKFD